MKTFLIVFTGGGLGSVLRFYLSRWLNGSYVQTFPWATLITNVAACFVLGYIIGLADHKQALSNASRMFWSVGFCGGFSTFSTFSQETVSLIQSGQQEYSLVYVLLSLFACLAATLIGQFLGKM